MPQHEYKCPEGHLTIRFVSIKDANEPKDVVGCEWKVPDKRFAGGYHHCCLKAERLAPLTGAPILRPGGVGGFYKPSRA